MTLHQLELAELEAVHAGTLEAGAIALPVDDRGLEVHPVLRDELVFASTEPERVREPITMERLARAPLVLPEATWGVADPTRRQLAVLAQRAGIAIEPEIEVEDAEAALELAARGIGDTIVARGMLLGLGLGRRVSRGLGWTPFAEPFYETYAFVWRRGARLSPATRAFIDLARERLAALARDLEERPPRSRLPES